MVTQEIHKKSTIEIHNGLDFIDSRDIIERIEELETDRDDAIDLGEEFDSDDAKELKNLLELAEQCEGYGDWEYGETLIRDDYFKEYAQDLAEDIYGMDKSQPWPYCHIDWEAAANALRIDYMCVEFDGVDYQMRA